MNSKQAFGSTLFYRIKSEVLKHWFPSLFGLRECMANLHLESVPLCFPEVSCRYLMGIIVLL